MKEQVSEQASLIATPQSGMSFWSLVAAGMGPWWALWLILTLPQIPEGQAPVKPQGFSELTSFENDKVQGFQSRRHRSQLAGVLACGGKVYAGPWALHRKARAEPEPRAPERARDLPEKRTQDHVYCLCLRESLPL